MSYAAAGAATGQWYLAVAGLVVDIYMGNKAESESKKRARKIRDNQVLSDTYARRIANQKLQAQIDDITRHTHESRLRSLETESALETVDNGLQGAAFNKIAGKYTREFVNTIKRYEDSVDTLYLQNLSSASVGQINTTDRINNIPIIKNDVYGTAANAAATYYGTQKQSDAIDNDITETRNKRKELEVGNQSSAGSQSVLTR